MTTTTPSLWLWLPAFLILAVLFNLWLDHGCRLNGVITVHGKVCIN